MATPADHDQGKNADDKAASAASAAASARANGGAHADDLPMVPSPKLGAGGHTEKPAGQTFRRALPALLNDVAADAAGESETGASGSQPRSLRFALLAATIACAAGVGALAGSLTASGMGHQNTAAAAIPQSADPQDAIAAWQTQLNELSALKASLETANRNTSAQLAKMSDRLGSLEHAQSDPAAKLAHIADVVDRLEKRAGAAADITGSIAAPLRPVAPAAAPKLMPPKLSGPVLHDWAVQGVRNGRAMVESRYGGLFLVSAGSVMPELGRVQQVRRQNGEWIVVTEKGLITQRP